jgi:hypothetical protein
VCYFPLTKCTHLDIDSSYRAAAQRHIDGALVHRIGAHGQDLALEFDGVSIAVLGLGLFSLLLVQGSTVMVSLDL